MSTIVIIIQDFESCGTLDLLWGSHWNANASNHGQLVPFLVVGVNLSWDSQNWDAWLDSKSLGEREKWKKSKVGKEKLIGDMGMYVYV